MMTIMLFVNLGDFAMGHSQAEKALNRERILAEAARQVRREGLESVSVGTLMKNVGLTHGGFYGHFENRSALLAEALQRALEDGQAKSRAASRTFDGLVRGYLSRAHRDGRDSGCAVAALAADVARADDEARAVMSRHVDAFIATVSETLDGDEARAMLAVSALVGALTLSRIVTDPARSDAILKAARDGLEEMTRARAEEPGLPTDGR
jgi:TetR/AcrR family transcriptional repressor of nem operon